MKKNKFFNQISKNKKNEKETDEVRDIHHFAAHVGSRCVQYHYYDLMNDILKNVDQEIDSFFANVSMDQWNEKYFDELYSSKIQFILKDLQMQRIQHHRSIQGILQEWHSYLLIYQQHIDELNQQLLENEKEIKKYEE